MTQLKTLPTYDPTLFEGAAEGYAQYRTKYPPVVFDKLAEIFNLNGEGRLLDLGTGPGLIAIPLRTRFEEVVAIDPDPDMIAEAQRQAAAVGANNITWLQQGAEFIDSSLGTFKLATIGRAFHWMERELVLERLYGLLADDGGIALLNTGDNPWESSLPWKKAALGVVKKWLGDRRRTGLRGEGIRKPVDPPHEVVIANSAFARQEIYEVPFEKSWTVDSYLGYLYTTAFSLKIFYGDNAPAFEADLKEALLQVEPSGHFTEELKATILVVWKK
ncbi:MULTISPECIES: class I SAM-dependent methyltransferase [Nostoc]|uniref:Class I SAM-dependent methyltransferase n=1 Tax=Nostoc paludosum FACHB-159 TaxID=2692908 RepID=A0ABR8KB27_9NOSO|nr:MULTISPECIES: class I SAM-dependent methyltransferase [Nostoc]MBD2679800.1 class I SAM-dependent methyltransferase [Nostoc sp. FACHB-857]MBD2736049.1 class I SAM-dependent methyltransferase [Nostoc paludosum FACHB-159]